MDELVRCGRARGEGGTEHARTCQRHAVGDPSYDCVQTLADVRHKYSNETADSEDASIERENMIPFVTACDGEYGEALSARRVLNRGRVRVRQQKCTLQGRRAAAGIFFSCLIRIPVSIFLVFSYFF